MRKSNKIFAAMLSAALAVGSLAGCGNKDTATSTESSTSGEAVKEESAVSATSAEEAVEMTTVTYWSGDAHSLVVYEELVKEFNDTIGKEKGINLVYEVIGGDSYTDAVKLAIETGEGPDIFNAGWRFSQYQAADQIYAIDEIPGGEEILEKYNDVINSNYQRDGKTYVVPVGATTQGLIYNKDMFKAAGLVDENGEATPPKTYEELREYAKILTNEAEKEYGIIYPMKWGTYWVESDICSVSMSSNGFYSFNPATGQYDVSGMKGMMETILGMKEDGSVYPGAESIDNDSARALFAEGKIGMKFGYSFDVGVLNDQFPAKCDWGVAPYPTESEDVRYEGRMSYGYSACVNKATEVDLEKIGVVLAYFCSDEVIAKTYEEGVAIPIREEIVNSVTLGEDAKKGWAEFAALVAISTHPEIPLETDLTGSKNISQLFLEDVMTGNMTVDEAIAQYNQMANEGIDIYYETHPEEKELHADRVNPDWEAKTCEWEY